MYRESKLKVTTDRMYRESKLKVTTDRMYRESKMKVTTDRMYNTIRHYLALITETEQVPLSDKCRTFRHN